MNFSAKPELPFNPGWERGFIHEKHVIDQFVYVVRVRQQVHHPHLMSEDQQGHYVARRRERTSEIERQGSVPPPLRIRENSITPKVMGGAQVAGHIPAAPELLERRSAIDVDLVRRNPVGSGSNTSHQHVA